MDTITERIQTAISDRGMFKRTVAQLAGIGTKEWWRHEKADDWRVSEVRKLADILQVPFVKLAGDPFACPQICTSTESCTTTRQEAS